MKSKAPQTTTEFSWSKLLPELLLSLIILTIFLVTVDVFQYLTTEYWWLYDSLNYKYTTIYLILLIIVFSFFNFKHWLIKWPKTGFLIGGLFIVTLFFHNQYTHFYNQLQQYPKIKKLSKNWGIQGSLVRITGRNFGEPHEQGVVYLDDQEMVIKKWSDKEIIFEVLVMDRGEKELILENKNNNKQKQELIFEVK
ncbi:MAG: IPT/TIG domain-containing protein [Candidatus Pacebacteria bacterium]|nr:IPT/TIG domain-containing protein [Candidatus Paceibacterota bacterium]